VKRTILLCIFVLVLVAAGGLLWFKQHGADASPSAGAAKAKPPEEEAPGSRVTRDAKGNAVITLSDGTQRNMGIQVTNPARMQLSPEVKGYGRVLDPGPLAALVTDLASAQAGRVASSNELARLKALEEQGNASARSLQAAEAAALRDQFAVQSAKDRLALSWGKAVADQKDLPGFIQSLISLETVLVRIDLPMGQDLKLPAGARVLAPSGQASEAEFVGLAPTVDPQMQGRGFLLRVKSNASRLSPGEAVVGCLKVPGEPLDGVVIPREAVVRTEGAGWVYVFDNDSGKSFARIEVPLDHPTEAGWFVTKGVAARDRLVVNGAQQLLSVELKGAAGE
jgi:hypothetical protein